jgi:hypothetical protein
MSSTLKDLHFLRQDKGEHRQPTFGPGLRVLDTVIRRHGSDHPYELRRDEMFDLMNNPSFAQAGEGSVAPIPSTQYLYRISSISKIQNYSMGWISATPRRDDQPWVVFRIWNREVDRTGDWLQFSKYAGGLFESPRGITFWSSRELRAAQFTSLLQDISAIGIPNSWLEEYCAILRCDVSGFGIKPRIPTVLDAFNSHIFHPTREADSPNSGMAIKLSLSETLTLGHEEFVLRGVDTSAIDVYPVFMPQGQTSYIDSYDSRLIDLLGLYYEALQA